MTKLSRCLCEEVWVLRDVSYCQFMRLQKKMPMGDEYLLTTMSMLSFSISRLPIR